MFTRIYPANSRFRPENQFFLLFTKINEDEFQISNFKFNFDFFVKIFKNSNIIPIGETWSYLSSTAWFLYATLIAGLSWCVNTKVAPNINLLFFLFLGYPIFPIFLSLCPLFPIPPPPPLYKPHQPRPHHFYCSITSLVASTHPIILYNLSAQNPQRPTTTHKNTPNTPHVI